MVSKQNREWNNITVDISIFGFYFYSERHQRRHVLVLTLDVLRVININFLLKISTPETHKELKRVTLICLLCPMLVFSFKSTIFGTRSKDSWPIKLRKRRDVILLHVTPLPRPPPQKKWPTNRGKTSGSRVSSQRLKPGSSPLNASYTFQPVMSFCQYIIKRKKVTRINKMLRLLSQMVLTTIDKSVGKACLCTEPPSLRKKLGGGGGLYTGYGKAYFFYLFFSFLSPPLAQCWARR